MSEQFGEINDGIAVSLQEEKTFYLGECNRKTSILQIRFGFSSLFY
jgi:hypothetical protein